MATQTDTKGRKIAELSDTDMKGVVEKSVSDNREKKQISIGMPNEYNNVHKDYIKEFFLSVRTGNLSKLKKYVEKDGIGVNIHDAWDNSPLYMACLCGHPHVVKYLLEKGAHYGGNIESERCFLASLTQNIRDILREYEGACVVVESKPETFADFLQKLYERVPDYDVQIFIQDQVFLSHRCILAVRCQYFYQRFFETAENSETDCIEISDPVFTPTSFRGILQYIYTGKLDVCGCDIPETKKLADYLGYRRLSEVLSTGYKKVKERAGKTVSEKHLLVKAYYKEFFQNLQTDFRKLIKYPPCIADTDDNTEAIDQRDYFTDVCFDVDGVVFECHKMFFYGRSEFFRTLLIEKGDEQPPAFDGYRPTNKLDSVLVLDFVEVVNYLYMDKVKIGKQNAEALLISADMFVIPELKQKCVEELNKHINSSNVLQIYQTSKTLDIPKLVNKCINIIAQKLNELSHVPQFQQLLAKELTVQSAGIPFSEIPFFDSLQYYIRDGASSDSDTVALANQKLHLLSEILRDKHGVNVSLPVVATSRGKNKQNSCIIL